MVASPFARLSTSILAGFLMIGLLDCTPGSAADSAGPVKLSTLDHGVAVPSLMATADGALHVIFAEQQTQSPYMTFLYYRSSRDGGASWTPPKNLSEDLPNTNVGNTRILGDSAGRVYAIWRSHYLAGAGDISQPASQRDDFNLVYRVLQNGAWSKQIYIHPPTSMAKQGFGSASWFAANEPSTGRVQVLWNTSPAPRHPEAYRFGSVSYGIKRGALMRVVLDGANPTPPQEFFHTPITMPNSTPTCEGFDAVSGYLDNAGQPHFLAQLVLPGVSPEPAVRFQLVENNKRYAALELPGQTFTYWHYRPQLLVDAQGRRHVIAMYQYGERQSVRDYIVGSNAEPQIVRAAKAGTGKVLGMQAFQGPGGRMAVLMQMADTDETKDNETYLVTGDGNTWNAPINLTNDTGRTAFHNTNTGSHSNTSTASAWLPGDAVAAFDRSGRVYVAFIVNRRDVFQQNAYGVSVGGSTSVPNLLFRRF